VLTKAELLANRDKLFPDEYTQQISDNLDLLLEKLNVVRAAYGLPMKVNSAWRPTTINSMTPGAAPNSKHVEGLACDFNDPDGKLFEWCLQNLDLLNSLSIYLEDPRWTRTKSGGGWVHMQVGGPKSRKRIYQPNQSLPIAPTFWNGKYDTKWDK
jgi:hypothetical protein